jgi:hypothetical protein
MVLVAGFNVLTQLFSWNKRKIGNASARAGISDGEYLAF